LIRRGSQVQVLSDPPAANKPNKTNGGQNKPPFTEERKRERIFDICIQGKYNKPRFSKGRPLATNWYNKTISAVLTAKTEIKVKQAHSGCLGANRR
jgi:hypothetical protein